MRRACILCFLLLWAAPPARAADLSEIVRQATLSLNKDWADDLKYACVEKEETHKGAKTESKTWQTIILEGSEYKLLLAVDDQPLSPDKQKAEYNRLKDEQSRRSKELLPVRRRRINEWKSRRDENGELLLDFPTHFTFELVKEEVKNGRPAYVLAASPKPGIVPTTRSEKVLSGMKGTVWVDKETLQPLFVDCTVTMPVPVFGMLASVLPGTEIEIELTAVDKSVWLIDLVSMKLDVSKLHMFRSTETTVTTYTQYRRNDDVVKELLEKAGGLRQALGGN